MRRTSFRAADGDRQRGRGPAGRGKGHSRARHLSRPHRAGGRATRSAYSCAARSLASPDPLGGSEDSSSSSSSRCCRISQPARKRRKTSSSRSPARPARRLSRTGSSSSTPCSTSVQRDQLHEERSDRALRPAQRGSSRDQHLGHRAGHPRGRASAGLRALLPRRGRDRPWFRARPGDRARRDRGRGRFRRAGIEGGRRDDGPVPVSAGCEPGGGVSKVLIVEDEPAVRDALDYSLRGEGFDVDAAPDGEAGLRAAHARDYDVVILDLMLPKMSGTEVCRRLRSESAVPIIMLTAKGAELDRVLGPRDRRRRLRDEAVLDGGADRADQGDSAPPSSSTGPARRACSAWATLELDPIRHEVKIGGEPKRLTPSEFKLLLLLAQDPGRVFSRREIMQHLWDCVLRRRPARVRHPHLEPPAEDRGGSGQSGPCGDRPWRRLQADGGR